ncbi:hypothetical protein [Shewanella sediminis]|uniref:hypothetical protein n=1 Tax=Shewanella sediminis TaxID=271097 RepID=UPI000306726D|nr:hypothetical protein [Shewanella sediminis]
MCSTPKTNLTAKMPKTPFRSFMASMTLTQRKRFAEVANRAEERREIREHYRQRAEQKTQNRGQFQAAPSLFQRIKLFCDQTIKLMG